MKRRLRRRKMVPVATPLEMTQPTSIWFKRSGRSRRARGVIVETEGAMTKVRPTAKRWKSLWLTREEIAAGVREEQAALKFQSRAPREGTKSNR